MRRLLASACAGAKTASLMLQGLLTSKLDAELAIRIAEVKGVLLVLQSQLKYAEEEQATMSSHITNLEAEIARYKREEQECYPPHQTPEGGVLVAPLHNND